MLLLYSKALLLNKSSCSELNGIVHTGCNLNPSDRADISSWIYKYNRIECIGLQVMLTFNNQQDMVCFVCYSFQR